MLLRIRHEFDQYVNVRPVKLLDGAPCPLKDVKREDINMTVIRENSEGEYAGANLNPEREFPSMFEPIHGSAPDIAGKQIANPLASIWSASQMLDFFGHEDWGKRLIDAIEKVMVEGKTLTPDMNGTAATEAVGDAVAEKL